MRKIIAVAITLAFAAPVFADNTQVVDPKFDKSTCTSFTGGVGGATTTYGNCDPVVVKQEVLVPGPVQIKEVPVVVPAPVQKKKVRE